MRIFTLVLSFALVVAVAGCEAEVFKSNGPPPGADGGPVNADAYPWDRDSGPIINPDPPQLDASCGGQTIPIQLVQKGDVPDLFLVVDRSSSMITPIDLLNWALGTKWQVMKKTLIALVEYYSVNANFGLSLFPGSGGDCAPGIIDVPLLANNAQAIKQALNATSPVGNTPTHTTLAAVHNYLQAIPPAKGGRYVLLATDGVPNCGARSDTDTSQETLAEVQKMAASGEKVFVVGFGGIVAGNPGLLNQLATAGGVPNPNGPHKFYPATNEQQLKQALFTIVGGIVPPPCTYKLASQPQDPDKVTVTFDGNPVPQTKSNKDGWNYTGGGTEITFFGSACDKLRTGQVQEVRFIFGCKGPVIE